MQYGFFIILIFVIFICVLLKIEDKKKQEKYMKKRIESEEKPKRLIEFYLEEVNSSEAKKIINSDEFENLSFESYLNGSRYKIISENDEILGEVPIKYIDIIKKYNPDFTYYIDKKLNNAGKMEYRVQISFYI